MHVRLSSPVVPFWVDVRLRSFDGRWLAVAELAGELELGLGCSAREAVADALLALGEEGTARLLAGWRPDMFDCGPW